MARPSGARVRHDTLRNVVYAVPLRHKPLSTPHECPLCQTPHQLKTVHLQLDDQGAAVVSAGVLDLLQTAGMPHLELDGYLLDPPTIGVSLNGTKPASTQFTVPIVMHIDHEADTERFTRG